MNDTNVRTIGAVGQRRGSSSSTLCEPDEDRECPQECLVLTNSLPPEHCRPLSLMLLVLRFIGSHICLLFRIIFNLLLSLIWPSSVVVQSLAEDEEANDIQQDVIGSSNNEAMSTIPDDKSLQQGLAVLACQKEYHRKAFEFISKALQLDEDHGQQAGKLMLSSFSRFSIICELFV